MLFRIISLKDSVTIRQIIRNLGQQPDALRQAFQEVANNPSLQREVLRVVGKYSTARRKFIGELAKNPRVRRTLVKIASQQTR
jgi:uncharacterized protein YneF (UPF0154 family)